MSRPFAAPDPPQSSLRRRAEGTSLDPPAPRRLSEKQSGVPVPEPLRESQPAAPAGAAAPPSAPVNVLSPREELQQGCWCRIGEATCRISHALGMGSFGTVWAAEDTEGSELAVKEICCNSHSDLTNALFELHLLRILGTAPSAELAGRCEAPTADRPADPSVSGAYEGSPHASCAGLVPSLVAHDSLQLGAETWRVRLLMTRVHGEPLDLFLEQRRARQEALEAGTLANGGLRQQFEEACFFAHELLVQLAPGFEHISSVALHRDVNSHNILVDLAEDSPRYGLVDFGLAVDSDCWCSEDGTTPTQSRPSRVGADGSATWHYLDVGGDCRYWPLAAWVQFLAGWRELASSPSLSLEYQTRLDLHALGITALQVLAELLPLPPESASGGRSSEILEGALEIGSSTWDQAPPEFLVLRLVWERYWSRVSPLHARLINTFHNGGDWDTLKLDCIQSNVHDKIAEDLRMLRAAIKEVGEACRRAAATAPVDVEADSASSVMSASSMTSAAGLFSALLLLITDGQSQEVTDGPGVWRAVQEALGPPSNNGVAKKPSYAPPCKPMTSNKAVAQDSVLRYVPAEPQENIRWQESNRRDAPSRSNSVLREAPRRESSRNGVQVREATLAQSRSAGSLPVLLLPRPRRISYDETRECSPAQAGFSRSRTARCTSLVDLTPKVQDATHNMLLSVHGSQQPPENLSRRLSDLKSKVAWLSQEMAKLGEKSEVVGRRTARQSG